MNEKETGLFNQGWCLVRNGQTSFNANQIIIMLAKSKRHNRPSVSNQIPASHYSCKCGNQPPVRIRQAQAITRSRDILWYCNVPAPTTPLYSNLGSFMSMLSQGIFFLDIRVWSSIQNICKVDILDLYSIRTKCSFVLSGDVLSITTSRVLR